MLDLHYLKRSAAILKLSFQSYNVASVFELSHLFKTGLLKLNSLPHACVRYLAPLLNLIVEFVQACNISQLSISKKLLGLGEQLFGTINYPVFRSDKIVVLVYRICKVLKDVSGNLSGLHEIHEIAKNVSNDLEISKIRASSRVWKKRGTVSLFRKPLIDIHLQVLEFNRQLNFWTSPPSDWFAERFDTEVVSGLITDCISTLHFLNSQKDMDQLLLKSMKSIPQVQNN